MDNYAVSSAPVAVAPNTVPCPGCHSVCVSKYTLLSLSTTFLDEALQKRKAEIVKPEAASSTTTKTNWHSEMTSSTPEIQAENHYLLVLRGHSSSVTGGDTSHQRTGRWTQAEVALTDFLVQLFDDGRLPMEQGIKLSDFLADILLCKSSRLSKKMKNSQLGTRSYSFRFPATPLDGLLLSQLVERFIQSISSEPMRYELQWNFSKFWRTRLSNLALELHQPAILDVSQWIAGLEVVEQKAAAAQERIRSARRRRLGMPEPKQSNGLLEQAAAQAATTTNPSTVVPPATMATTLIPTASPVPTDVSSEQSHIFRANELMTASLEEIGIESFLPQPIFPVDSQANGSKRRRRDEDGNASRCHSAGGNGDDLSESTVTQSTKFVRSHCGPFLTQLMHYIEGQNFPFQAADVWVPSYSNDMNPASQDNLKLFHAGYVTRNDLEWGLSSNLEKFGKESNKVTFVPGSGLPGRVFWSGQPEWLRFLDTTTPEAFVRVDLANQCGVKTGFCFPLATNVIGKICVAMYSTSDLAEDRNVIDQCMKDLAQLCPEPKWKLVVEVSNNAPDFSSRLMARAMSDHEPLEKRIATLLGDHMPLSDLTSAVPPTEAERKREALLPHFLSLRLLLLRQVSRRTAQEKDRIQLILDSFRGYDTGRRSDEDLAFLIVRDWVYIGSSSHH